MFSSKARLGFKSYFYVLAGVLGLSAVSAEARFIRIIPIHLGVTLVQPYISFSTNRPHIYYAFDADLWEYTFVYGVDANGYADHSVPGPNLYLGSFANGVPSSTVYATPLFNGSTFFGNFQFQPSSFVRSNPPYYHLAWQMPMPASYYASIISRSYGPADNTASWNDYCANTIGYGGSVDFKISTTAAFTLNGSTSTANGPVIDILLDCVY